MIRKCDDRDFETIYEIINEAAQVYKGIIPADRWKDPYMPRDELKHEIEANVRFWGYDQEGELLGVMGIQDILAGWATKTRCGASTFCWKPTTARGR